MQDLGKAPRWFLIILLSAVSTVATWQTMRWVAHVEDHIEESRSGYERIASIEARLTALEQRLSRRDRREANGR